MNGLKLGGQGHPMTGQKGAAQHVVYQTKSGTTTGNAMYFERKKKKKNWG